MLLTQENPGLINQIVSYDDNGFIVSGQRHDSPLIVGPQGPAKPWPVTDFATLTADAFRLLVAEAPAVVLVGTGRRQHFPHPGLLEPLISARIGYEIMDTGSACRTFNLLAAEGRLVFAALLLAAGE